ncbi:hypothetical protein [Paenibacillus cellulosilyticus]|uniref:hypothetical protein n=1 Tax=Paenibacillus cellulosilyticus TaxID=375489 RepID=UPI001FE8795E
MQLSYLYWKETGRDHVFHGSFDKSIRAILRLRDAQRGRHQVGRRRAPTTVTCSRRLHVSIRCRG